jgi:hypothetical protein
MKAHHNLWLLLCAAAGFLTLGCALLSKGDPGEARFFNLEMASPPSPPPSVESVHPPKQPLAGLRVGRVTGALYLEERLVFRGSPNEIVYYRELRWTEPPERFFERLLARILFEQRGLAHLVGGTVRADTEREWHMKDHDLKELTIHGRTGFSGSSLLLMFLGGALTGTAVAYLAQGQNRTNVLALAHRAQHSAGQFPAAMHDASIAAKEAFAESYNGQDKPVAHL